MACLGVKPGAAGWKVQTNPLSYGGTPNCPLEILHSTSNQRYVVCKTYHLEARIKQIPVNGVTTRF